VFTTARQLHIFDSNKMWLKQQNATSPSVPQQMAAPNGTLIEFEILIALFRK
jgi:hypothetical protein